MTLDALSIFGLFAVLSALVSYALEDRSPWWIFAFAIACVLSSVYGFLQGVAIRNYRNCMDDCGALAMVEGDSSGRFKMKDISKLFIDIPKDATWVALDHDQHRVVAYGTAWDEVTQKAKDAGENFPSMCKMREADEPFPDTK